MGNERRFIRDNRNLMLVLTAISVLLTVYSMPKNHEQRFSYTVGKPWTYDVLIAPFNFSIQKTDESWQAEADSLKAAFAPYFTRKSDVTRSALAQFEQFYTDSLCRIISRQSYDILHERMETVYEDGIISVSDEEILQDKAVLRIVEGNTSSVVSRASTRSIREAYRFFSESDILAYDRYALLQHHLEEFFQANLTYDAARTETDLKTQLDQISHFRGMVVADQKIIDQGEIVNEETSQIIRSYLEIVNERSASKRFQLMTWGGQAVFAILCFLFLIIYIRLYRIDDIDSRSVLYFLYGSVTLFTVGVCLFVQYTSWSIFLLPCAMLAIMLRIFIDSRTAFTAYLVFVLTTSIITPMPFEYIVLQLFAGLTGIYSLKELEQRSQILRTCLLTFLAYCIAWGAMQMIQLENIRDLDPFIFLYFAINSVLLLLVYPLLLLIEKVFGFTSNVTLIELSNFNNPLLRELAEKAPGTFQHSIQVSTLAAYAASRIKANPQLVRTAALYHDIGKIANAPFFTENQSGVNPHDKLSPQDSAVIITGHVDDGLALAEKAGLPEEIRHFIATHHGKGVARYFFTKYVNDNPDGAADVDQFSYPGPNPDTKETAILMMADAAEAASRSLKEYTEESIGSLVDRIIDTQVSEGYFRDCPISWKEIGIVKDVFKEKLKIAYHTRISYPESTVGQRQRKQ